MANLVEIFPSVQGEGLYIGVRQLFIRFCGCNLECKYCDTEHQASDYFRVYQSAGIKEYVHYPNPADPETATEIISRINQNKIHSVSLTGGEPLLHSDFIKKLACILKEKGMKVYLETNGTLREHLSRVIDEVDIISMDIKLPWALGGQPLWEEHKKFLNIARKKEVFVKVVVSIETTTDEIINTCSLIKEQTPDIPLVIQPVTSHSGYPGKDIPVNQLLKLQDLALEYLKDVRVIPQTHKYLGII